MVSVVSRCLLLIAGLAVSPLALAQARDPTLPPKGYYVPPANQVAPDAADPSEISAPRALQVIIRHHAARPVAVIDGQAIPLGGRFEDKRLVRVAETEVQLAGASGRETLAMTSAVQKMPIVLADARPRRGEKQ